LKRTLPPASVKEFMLSLPVSKIWGVGKVTETKLFKMGIINCGQLQKISLGNLIESFGNFGIKLYHLSRGKDDRIVTTERQPKSLSVESTYIKDLVGEQTCLRKLPELMQSLQKRAERKELPPIKSQFVKLKFCDFSSTTAECSSTQLSLESFKTLCQRAYSRKNIPVRLVGVGMHFHPKQSQEGGQLDLPLGDCC